MNNSQNIYQTGSTMPPKSHYGLITVLIILIIVLCGVISVLSMMNIRLFRMLNQQRNMPAETAISFYPQDEITDAAPGVYTSVLGLEGQELSDLYRNFYDLPQGLYISHITPGGPADLAKLQCGDILQAINAHPVTTEGEFLQIITDLQKGQDISVTVCRDQNILILPLTLEK